MKTQKLAGNAHVAKSKAEPVTPKYLWSVFRSDEELKASGFVLEEDEGFSDWSHRLENRNEPEVQDNFRAKERNLSEASVPGGLKHEEDEEEEHGERSSEEASTRHSEKVCSLCSLVIGKKNLL